jgi:stage II sporulation protein D
VGEVADVTVQSGVVKEVGLKRERIQAKVLAVSEEYVELEGYGSLEFTEGFQMYGVYDTPYSQSKEEIMLGYDYQQFVLEDGRVCAALTVEELQVDRIRVLLKTTDFASIFHQGVTLYCEGDYVLTCGDSETRISGGEEINIAPDSLYFADGWLQVEALEGDELYITSITRSSGNPGYEGHLELRTYEEGIVVVNELPVEDYLKRVVPSEMSPSSGLEAVKVQAVCARSYAYGQIQNRTSEFGIYASYGAHVDDSTAFQVYNNVGENETCTRAVLETTGQVMTYQDQVISAYFFSTSCGVTTDLSIWSANPEAAPYLSSKSVSVEAAMAGDTGSNPDYGQEEIFDTFIKYADPNALEADYPWYRWSFQADLSELAGRINEKLSQCIQNNPSLVLVGQEDGSFAPGSVESIGELVGLTVLQRGSGGVIDQLLIEGTLATVIVCKQSNVRLLLGDPNQVYSNGLTNSASSTGQLPSAFCCFEGIYEGETLIGYTIYGGGNGHGVGMSQNGAKELANAGLSYIEILEYFYTGVEIKK